MPVTREWTVMFFFASDNPLAPGTISQLKAIKNAGYHPEANVIAHFDPHTVNMPVHVFDVNLVEKLKHEGESNIGFTGNDSFVRNLVLDKLWDKATKEQIKKRNRRENYDPPVPFASMSDEQSPKKSLEDFLEFCRLEYPAHHYMLFIIGHGIVVGNDLFMLDEHGPTDSGTDGNAVTTMKDAGKAATEKDNSPQHTLRLKDLSRVLGEFNAKIKDCKEPGQFELMGFHSCSMSGVEVALQLKDTANYMLASQGPSYVGSWPYRQILIRLFNDLKSPESPTNGYPIACSLIDKLKDLEDEVSMYLRGCLGGNGQKLVQANSIADKRELVQHLVEILSKIDLSEVKSLREKLPKKTKELLNRHLSEPSVDKDDLARLNRLMLESHYLEQMTKVRIREMLTKIFYYYMYNSFDFQLAGYSSDLTLCDLTKVHYIQEPLNKLAAALIEGLDYAHKNNDPLIREAILLAHWEAQSFYEEKYTDLYDFCFRLSVRCQSAPPATDATILGKIIDACDMVMKLLRRGVTNNDYGPIVRSEFSGAEYQYSHGLSIFFPWSEPVGNLMWKYEYAEYELNTGRGTCWKNFLDKYFEQTMRKTQEDENDPLETRSQRSSLDEDLLEILQKIAARASSDDGVLKAGPKDPLGPGKGGAKDPTGSDCECDTIKNYPSFTRALASPDLIRRVANQLDDDSKDSQVVQ